MKIPLVNLKRHYEYMKKDIDVAIAKCLEHQQWILGPEVHSFEDDCKNYLGAANAIGTSSGTEALVIALRALSLKTSGEEFFTNKQKIITTPFTFVATGDAILRSGATPVFIDINPNTYNIDPSELTKCLEKTEDVVGILPVHLFGLPCDMNFIMKIARDRSLFVLEDCAQSFGATINDKKTGAIGSIGAHSFFPSKNLGAFGDAGLISTNDNDLNEYCRSLVQHGSQNKTSFKHIGYNARLDALQAATLEVRLKFVDEFNDKRRSIAQTYIQNLHGLPEIEVPTFQDTQVYHQFTIKVPMKKREAIQTFLIEQGISSAIYYPYVLNELPLFEKRSIAFGKLKSAKSASLTVLSLPMDPLLTEEEIAYICNQLKEGLDACAV